jgi:dihydrolipoamide dehydrogenase
MPKYEYNMVVIGGGSAGLVTSYISAAIKSKVALIEKHKMGGDCLNTGCVPSKALIRSAKMLAYAKRHKEFGFKNHEIEFDFSDVMERVQRVIKTIEPHDSMQRYRELGVDCIEGAAKIIDAHTVEVEGRKLTTANITIATGAGPFIPPIPGLDQIKSLNTDNLWELRELPKRLAVLGGGPIGCELAQCFARLGSEVTQVEMAPSILIREDPEVSQMVINSFKNDGINIMTSSKAIRIEPGSDEHTLVVEKDGQEIKIPFDQILVAVGRAANTKGFGAEEIGIELTERRTIKVDDYLRTSIPNIYACGDVAGPYQFTHTAAHQAWYCAVNAHFSPLKKFKVDYSVIPWCTYTDPEIAQVGLNEEAAKQKKIPYEVTTYDIDDLDRAITDEEAHGLVKILTEPGQDKILGVTICGHHAGDLIAEYVLAMKHGLGLEKILGTIHIYPTLAEANKFAAGNWKKAHVADWKFNLLEKFHGWRR